MACHRMTIVGSGESIELNFTNPAHAVRGPKHVVKTGKTTVLTGEQAAPAALIEIALVSAHWSCRQAQSR
jgi:hypothetical protein